MKLTLYDRELLNALALYFGTKRSSFRAALSLRAPLSTEQAQNLRMHYSSYFSNLISATELIRENEQFEPKKFMQLLESKFVSPNSPDGASNYAYVRELRNSIVHRGLDISSAAHFDNNLPLLIAPSIVRNRTGNQSFQTIGFYVLDVIFKCENAVGPAVEEHLSTLGILDRTPDPEEWLKESIEFIEQSNTMPDWAKKAALQNMPAIDFNIMHQAKIAAFREALKPNPIPQRIF